MPHSALVAKYKMHVRSETTSRSTIRIRDHYIHLLTRDVDILTATETDLEDWLRAHGWAPTSQNSALANLRHIYRWLERYGHRTDNPARYIRRARVPRKMGRIASDAAIIAATMKSPVDTRVMIMLGAECGLRREEIAKTHMADIDGEWLHVVGKGGHERMVHLSPELLELLAYMPRRGFLFPGQVDGHLSVEAIYKRIRRASGLNPHSLRHRAGTTVYEGTGNNLRVAQEFLGHATVATTSRYVHTTRDDLKRASTAARLAA